MFIIVLLSLAIIILVIWLSFISKDISKLIDNQKEFLKFNVENTIDIKKLYKMFKAQDKLNEQQDKLNTKIISLIDKMCVKQDEPKKVFKGTKNEQIVKE